MSGLKMGPVSPSSQDEDLDQSPIDPISQQILERTKSPTGQPPAWPSHTPGPSDDQDSARVRGSSEAVPLRRIDSTASNKLTKEKKKGVSFLSRIMGGKKRDDVEEVKDTVSEISENRSAGNEAEVFSAPLGYVPRFPGPPKYIKVKAQNKKKRDFDRLFLAQILQESSKSTNRKASIDSKIHSITDAPAVQPPANSRSSNNAIWAMEFSKDGRYLAAAGQDKKLRVWEVIQMSEDRDEDANGNTEGEKLKLHAPVFKQKLVREYDGHTSSILDLSWSKNNFLLSSSMDKSVRLYHISRAECLCAFRHNDFVTSIQFHPRDDRFFLAGSLDSKIRLWSIPDKNVAYWQQVPDMVTAVAFTPDGKTAIAGTLGGLCILYDTEGLRAHSQIHVKSARGKNSKGSKVTGIDTITVPRENGQSDVKILITSNDSRIRMYNLKDRNLEIKFRGNENSCSQIHATFSDDGKFVICGSEDRKVYVWPTGPYDRSDNDKRPMEVFEAHSTIVTTALLVPAKTRRMLAQSGDPIYDLCNPPPVTLLSRADSVLSSRAPTHNSNHSGDEKRQSIAPSRTSESPKRAPESPAYLARHAHMGGYILVTADYTGQIKVFRHDCAFQKRRQESWDDSSTFSKKMLARSGSVMTRNSVASSAQQRNSANYGNYSMSSVEKTNNNNQTNSNGKNGSSERILNWRNSINLGNNSNSPSSATASEVNFRQTLAGAGEADRARSVSPGNSTSVNWKKRLSLRRGSTPPKPSQLSGDSPGKKSSLAGAPAIEVTPETPDSPGTFHSSKSQESRSNSNTNALGSAMMAKEMEAAAKLEADGAAGGVAGTVDAGNEALTLLQRRGMTEPGDPLLLVDGQSMMAWDISRTVVPMAQRMQRTPGLLGPDGNPLSRQGSFVSELSSEFMSSEGVGSQQRGEGGGGSMGDDREERRGSVVSGGTGVSREEELRCNNCGGTEFRASRGEGGQKLRCKRCNTVV